MPAIINFFKEQRFNILFLLLSILYIYKISGYYHNIFIDQNLLIIKICKVLGYILLITVSLSAAKLLKGLYEKNEKYIKFATVFWIYFTVNIIIYFMTDGGVYNGDESRIIYNSATGFIKDPISQYLTIIYHIISYSVLPFVKAAVPVHITFISALIAYIYTKLSYIYKIKYNFIWLIPFFLPPVLRMNIQPLRNNLYYPFFLLLIAYLFFRHKEEKEIKTIEVIILGILSAIICIWRNENILLLLILPIIIKQLFGKFINLKKLVIYCLILFSLTFCSNIFTQKYEYKYKTLAIVRPLFQIIKTDFKTNDKKSDLEKIGKVFKIEEYKGIPAENLIFLEEYAPEISSQNVKNTYIVFIKLVLLNPEVYIKDRINIIKTETCFLRDSVYIYKNPDDIKEKILNLLEFRTKDYKLTKLTYIFYNTLIPCILLLLTTIHGIKRKNKFLIFIPAILVLLSVIITLTCAEQFFHYYLISYIAGYFFLCFYISLAINKKTS